MGLTEKIEEIRRKPEYIRLRYVWFFVGLGMIFVIMIWISSIKAERRTNLDIKSPINDLGGIVNEFGSQTDTLKNSMEAAKEAYVKNAKNLEAQSPADGEMTREGAAAPLPASEVKPEN